MRRGRIVVGIGLLLAVAAASPTLSGQRAERPRIENAQVETRSAAGGLSAQVRALMSQPGPAWIGYAVPLVEGRHSSCCSWSEHGSGCCRLEASSHSYNIGDREGSVRLEGPRRLAVLLRVERGAVGKVRSYTEECGLDAGGLRFTWLTDVVPAESVALLRGYVGKPQDDSDEHIGGSALAAIALHADPSADAALEQMAAPSQPVRVREKAAFWLGAARGRRGHETLKRMLNEDPSEDVQEKVVFALSVSKEPAALDTLIQTARSHRSAEVRGQAIFWLGQKAGKKAAATLTEAVEDDPELEIKKRAVFALSQLPPEEGVPLLIRVARTHPQPEVRKKAIFWLGQSKDPRALTFFEEVLKR
ncbi:MAG: HEAT repeat domain-containing protein [Acidobacteria bacterium]|nr:HEAT repeat domain-containing protein [Acidobacteriota bacterium]